MTHMDLYTSIEVPVDAPKAALLSLLVEIDSLARLMHECEAVDTYPEIERRIRKAMTLVQKAS